MFWQRKASPENCGHALYEFLLAGLRDKAGRIRAEDFISATASIAGERCIEAAGILKPHDHAIAPGTRVFSDKVNTLLCGDLPNTAMADLPAASVFGMLRDRLLSEKYDLAEFPEPTAIFKGFAASIGKTEDWGKVPLSVPQDNQPNLLPLRVTYETRQKVDQLFAPLGADSAAKLQAAVLALAETLNAVAGVIDHKTALLLALETLNGMAKTAPMTAAAMAKAQQKPTGA